MRIAHWGTVDTTPHSAYRCPLTTRGERPQKAPPSKPSLPEAGTARGKEPDLKPTDIRDPAYFHKVVDCQ